MRCTDGYGLHVVATGYLNKLAAEGGLPYRATFRGTSPQDDLSARAVAGLKEDGILAPSGKPAAITDGDVAPVPLLRPAGRAKLAGSSPTGPDLTYLHIFCTVRVLTSGRRGPPPHIPGPRFRPGRRVNTVPSTGGVDRGFELFMRLPGTVRQAPANRRRLPIQVKKPLDRS
jgi:hypothetical protein